MANLNASKLRELITYEPATGRFFWLKPTARCCKVGDIAGYTVNSHGYVRININGRSYGAHRLAFLIMTGEWPTYEVDHIDGDPSNNRWMNLREATRAQNNQNRRNAGVGRCNGKWRAYIKVYGIQRHIGMFDTEEEAIAAYRTVARQAFGEYARNVI